MDRAALDAAIAGGVPIGGWCPAGRRAEDGPIPERYPLVETATSDYAERTRLNVLDAEAPLVLAPAAPVGGTSLTLAVAREHGRPVRVVDPAAAEPAEVAGWIGSHGISELNVAGPRESEVPGIYREARAFMERLLAALAEIGAIEPEGRP